MNRGEELIGFVRVLLLELFESSGCVEEVIHDDPLFIGEPVMPHRREKRWKSSATASVAGGSESCVVAEPTAVALRSSR